MRASGTHLAAAESPRRLTRLGNGALAILATLVGGSWLVGALAHIDDGRSVDHVAGTWMALATAANAGTLYPPLADDGFFGGTRFAPLPIVLQAGAARISGEYLVSAKVLGLALAAVLLVLTYVAVRRASGGTPIALVLASSLLVSGTGLAVTTGIRNDALALVMQLAAILLVAHRRTRGTVPLAGVLCALAVAAKLSAVWAPLAIGVWLLRRDRRELARFAGLMAGTLVLVFGVFETLSAGRLSDNLVGLTLTAPDRLGSLDAQVARLRAIATEGLGLLTLVVILAAVATVLAAVRRRTTLAELSFAAACLVTFLVILDPGAFVNHVLDVQVLALPVVGRLWREAGSAGQTSLVVRGVVLLAILVGIAVSYRENVNPRADLRALATGRTAPADRLPPLAGRLGKDERVLSEDPTIPVLRGQRPVVLDPYMLIAVLEKHPEAREELVGRIEAGEFGKIVLFHVPVSSPDWYRNIHLGSTVVAAIESRYRPTVNADGYWLYEPR